MHAYRHLWTEAIIRNQMSTWFKNFQYHNISSINQVQDALTFEMYVSQLNSQCCVTFVFFD